MNCSSERQLLHVWHRCKMSANMTNQCLLQQDSKRLASMPNVCYYGQQTACQQVFGQTVQVTTLTRFMTFGIDVKRLLLWPTKVLLYRVPSPTSTKGYNSTTPHDVSRGTFPLRPNTTAPCTAPSDPTTQLVLRRVKLEELETVRKAFRNVQITQNMLISWPSTQNA